MAKITNIYPEQFFNISSPSNVFVEIQFRVLAGKISEPIEKQDIWKSVTYNPNNFFDSISIEDEAGFQNLTLSLKDRDFVYLERTVTAALLAARINQSFSSASQQSRANTTVKKSSSDVSKYFNFFIDNSSSVNLRVRFGYTEQNTEGKYISSIDKDTGEFSTRNKSAKPVIRSPWLYFMILNANYSVFEDGMGFSIKGISTSSAYIERAKILVQGAILKGKPREIITDLNTSITRASNGDCVIDTSGLPSMKAKTEDGIVVLRTLASSPTEVTGKDGTVKRILDFRTLKQLLNEFCSNIEPDYIDNEGVVQPTAYKSIKNEDTPEENTELEFRHSAPLSFYVEEKKQGSKLVNVIKFYRQNPYASEQTLVRNYTWRGNEKSIVTEFSVSTQNDFAQMNSPISVSTENGLVQVCLGVTNSLDDIDPANPRVTIVKELYNESQSKELGATFTTAVMDSNSKGGTVSAFMSAFVENINKSVFQGSLTVPLDPFYLFDKVVQPYVYRINVIINTPSYINEQGTAVPGGKSYLTGNYVIKKITHNISYSGGSTNLEISRFPEIKKVNSTPKTPAQVSNTNAANLKAEENKRGYIEAGDAKALKQEIAKLDDTFRQLTMSIRSLEERRIDGVMSVAEANLRKEREGVAAEKIKKVKQLKKLEK